MGNSKSAVQPTIEVEEKEYRTVTNSSVVLSCRVRGADRCIWRLQGKDITVPSFKHRIVNEYDLEICPVGDQDQGEYTCEVINNDSYFTAKSEAIILKTFPFYNIKWNDNKQKLDILKEIEDAADTDARIVLFGHMGAGKSSFLNSLQAAVIGRISTLLPQGSRLTESKTQRITYLTLDRLPATIIDVPGYKDSDDGHRDDCVLLDILQNKVENGTEFTDWGKKPREGNSVAEGQAKPVYCVVYVVDCESISYLANDTMAWIRRLQKSIERLGFQMVVLITKIDELVKKDVSKIYGSDDLQKSMKTLRRHTGIDESSMYPIQSYSGKNTESELNMDLALLHTFKCLQHRLQDISAARRAGLIIR